MAPQAGFEPATDRLTADCSTTELLRMAFSGFAAGVTLFFGATNIRLKPDLDHSSQRPSIRNNCLVRIEGSQGLDVGL